MNQKQIQNLNQRFKSYYPNFNLEKPQLRCEKGQIITQFCIETDCKYPALLCNNLKCQFCHSAHKKCSKKLMQTMNQLLYGYLQKQKQFYFKIEQIQNELIEMIQLNKTETLKQIILFNNLPQNIKAQIQNIYIDCIVPQTLNGMAALDLYNQLSQSLNSIKAQEEQILQIFKQQSLKMIEDHLKFKEEIFKIYFSNAKINAKQERKDLLITKSKIMGAHIYQSVGLRMPQLQKYLDKIAYDEWTKNLDFFQSNLGKFKDLQLLFRASEHKFCAKKFHEICDNAQNTLVIIHNQYQKSFGGFSPSSWLGNKWIADESLKSFIFSLDLLQRMDLKQPKCALYNDPHYGPTYGSGYDIFISNNCHKNKQSYVYFPHSYVNPKFQKGESSHVYTNSKNTIHFRVKQYQVFKVIF